MRALVQTGVGGTDVLRTADLPVPEVRAGTLLVRVTAIGLNFHDVENRRRGEEGLAFPTVPGTDVVGVVEETGPGVTDFAPGDRVVALARGGGCAEYALAWARTAAKLPDGVDDALAAGIPTAGLTAWFLLERFVPAGTRAVAAYAAAGGVGHWLGGLLARRPVRSIGLVSSPRKAELARAAGWTHTVDRTADPVRAVRRAAWGYGACVVLDPVAGPGFADSFRMLRPGGTAVLYGRAGGPPDLGELPAAFLDVRRNLGLRTWFLGRELTLSAKEIAPALRELVAEAAAGRITLPVTELPLSAARHAHALLESGSSEGKLVLRP
ncbi:zinc-binding dehydrogenase [Streptomyces sp. NPDC051940]|uniref:quinone oxidoreductase family protein n=1 Tax=Streptomyces sp. NPDC051940 TaxID=3155675 RepID=UPI0034148B94